MPSDQAKPFDVAIVGGGITGLALAIGLERINVPFTLYESAHHFGEIGAGVAFGPNSVRAMQMIDPSIREGFSKIATSNQSESKYDTWFDYRIGDDRWYEKHPDKKDQLKEDGYFTEVISGPNSKMVHRAQFLDEMVKLVRNDIAKFGKRMVELKELENGDVELKFADGTTATHNAVIGCDGIHSRTRQIVLGEDHSAAKAVYSGKYAYRGLIDMEKAVKLLGDKLARNSQMWLGYHGHVLTFPIEKGKTMNVVAFASSEKWDDPRWVTEIDREVMMKDFEGWGKHVHDILSLMTTTTTWALFNHPPAPTYYKGRICLLGDAAHASTPHQGAGAGMGIEDALVMQNILAAVDKKEDLLHAFDTFDRVRRQRTHDLVTTSWDTGRLYEFEKQGVNDDIDKISEDLSKRLRWIWDFDLEAHIKEAQEMLKKKVAA